MSPESLGSSTRTLHEEETWRSCTTFKIGLLKSSKNYDKKRFSRYTDEYPEID